MSSATRDIVVVGASAGGVQALQTLVRGLPRDFPASVLVVVHISPTSESALPSILSQAGPLPAAHPRDGEHLEWGRVYVAPPDHHLIVKSRGRLAVSRQGPRENGFRPAIDPLFRTAARCYGPRVIGIVLTGGLDDGTLGLAHIKENDGIAIVQDPAEAVFRSMPQSAIDHVEVDHVLQVAAMPALLALLVREPLAEGARRMVEKTDEFPDVAEVAVAEHGVAEHATAELGMAAAPQGLPVRSRLLPGIGGRPVAMLVRLVEERSPAAAPAP